MLIQTNSFQVTAPALLFAPEFHLFDVSPDLESIKFLVVEENNLEQAPFIDIRFEPLAQGHFTVPTKQLISLENMHDMQRPAPMYIFHHAFVCSTLLARCLNQIDAFFSLKEPWILRRLSDIKRSKTSNKSNKEWQELVTTCLRLLSKNYHRGKHPVIKVTNVANNLVEDILKSQSGEKILYLYSDLEAFLISNLKKPAETQRKMPGLAANFLRDSDFINKHPSFCQLNQLNFLQICGIIWVVNLYNFKFSTQGLGSNQIKTLFMKDFLADMEGTLSKLSAFFNHQASTDDLAKMIDPSVTQTDAKHQHIRYGTEHKKAESEQILKRFGNEISAVNKWLSPLIDELGLLDYLNQLKL